jgi:hypothetical protein
MSNLGEQLKNQFGLDTEKLEKELLERKQRIYTIDLKDTDTGGVLTLQVEADNVVEALNEFQTRLKRMDTIDILKKIEFPMTNLSEVDKVILRLLNEIRAGG